MKKLYLKLFILLICPCFMLFTACKDNDDYDLTIDSIYALVQSKGYTGSMAEFLEDISGEDGVGITTITLTSSNGNTDTYTKISIFSYSSLF